MKKTPNGRKSVHAGKDGRNDGLVCENDTENLEAVKTGLEARLQRLENGHSNGSTDVYKFVFFFFMGVVLTVLIYPRISSTFDTAAVSSPNDVPTKTAKNPYTVEQIDDLEDAEETIPTEEPIKAKVTTESWKYKQSNETESIPVVRDQTNKREVQTENDNSEDQRKSDENEQTNKETDSEDRSTESASLKHERVDLKSERVEDLMIEEIGDSNVESMPISFTRFDGDVNTDSSRETENVELFSANIDEIQKETPLVAEKAKKAEQNLDSKKNSKKSHKSEKTSQPKSRDKNKKTEAISKADEKIPKEIRDFKATYQKELTPKKVFIDGRRIPPMELLPQKPNNSSVKIWLFEDFLSEEECDGLMRVHNKHVQEQSKDDPILCFDSIATLRKHIKSTKKRVQVTPNDFTPGTTCVNASFSGQLQQWLKSNWSYSTAFYPGESRFASAYEQRVKQAMGLNPENGGKFQITSYPKDIGYKSHTDCTENSEDKRDRMATVLVYLDTVSEGGETAFPELGVWARPRKGRALLWNSMNPAGDCEPMSIHKANKVVDGHKYILQRWYYYKSFYSLGKRPPEPPLPERKPGQPRVSCDEYEHGSCRWYDEWNFEHMIEYERQKYTLV